MSFGSHAAFLFGIDGGVVNHRVDAADAVHLVRQTTRLVPAREVTDHDGGGPGCQIAGAGGTIPVASVAHHVVAEVQKLSSGAGAEPGGGAGDQNSCHLSARARDRTRHHQPPTVSSVLMARRSSMAR